MKYIYSFLETEKIRGSVKHEYKRSGLRHVNMISIILVAGIIFCSFPAHAQKDEQVARINQLITKLERGQSVFGLVIGNRSVETGRMLRNSGLDFVIIDMEHMVYDYTALQKTILGMYEQPFPREYLESLKKAKEGSDDPVNIDPDVPTPLVKIARKGRENIEFDVRHSLKMGAKGVFIPFTESGADIEAAVRAAENPEGTYNGSGFHYSLMVSWDDMEERSMPWPLHPKGEYLIGAMIESQEGVDNFEEIVNTPGLSMVWFVHVDSEEQLDKCVAMCKERNIIYMNGTDDETKFKELQQEGYQMFYLGWDIGEDGMFNRGLKSKMKAVNKYIGKN